MPHDWKKVSLDTIAGGAGVEKFNDGLDEVIGNILDPNTDQDKTREVKLTLKIKPSLEDRGKVLYALVVETKLAGSKPVGAIMFMGQEDGEFVAFEQNVEQGDLFDKPKPAEVIKINGGSASD